MRGINRFKFRAWDLKNKCMEYAFFICSDGGSLDYASKTYDTPNIELECASDLIIMQFTGLTDKNGNLIYEGDFLGGVWQTLYIEWCEECKSLQVKMKDHGCSSCSGDCKWDEVVKADDLEVIGNIYENPELHDDY